MELSQSLLGCGILRHMGEPKIRDEFKRLYAMLNTEQREAVLATEGPVMVVAGPGTGKTQILTLRIANILLKTDVPADAVLALTFTNAAVTNMRKRLVSIIGSDAYRVSIYTFHSFAIHLIESYPEWFGTVAGFTNVSDVERIDIVRSLIDAGGNAYAILRPIGNAYHNVPAILGALSDLKREGLTPERFSAWVTGERERLDASPDRHHKKGAHKGKMRGDYQKAYRMNDKLTELAHLYTRYQEELARRKRYDFDDALLLVIAALEAHEDFLRELQEGYQYLLVDEHQDTNGAQNRILELLASFFDRPNLFVVGDEKQAIFRFQGASLANFLYFEKKFKDVRRITLTTNYRSHQGVLDAAHTLIGHSAESISAPLTAHTTRPRGEDLRIRVYEFNADDEELLFLAESVAHLIESGIPAHEIAVLYRTNRDAEPVADYFERLSIPFVIESGHGVLDDPDIRKLNTLMRALQNLEDDSALAHVLFIDFLAIPVADVYTLIRIAREKNRRLFDVLMKPGAVTLEGSENVRTLARHLVAWKKSAENESFLLFFERVVRESGILTYIGRSTFHTEKYDKIVRLFDEVKAHVRHNNAYALTDYITFLAILDEHRLALEATSRTVPNAVRLMTAHKAKGLEFDHVFIIGAHDARWGGRADRSYFNLPAVAGDGTLTNNDTEDERRLFYVALTRARKAVYVSYASRSPDGTTRIPSRFLTEIHDSEKRTEHGDVLGYSNKRPPLFVERKGRHGKVRYAEFVKAAFNERGLSATALNNYLTCPWKWFYESFFHTQFVQSAHQVKGTTVHHALERYFNARNKNSRIGKEVLLRHFREQMAETDLEPALRDRISTDVGTALSGWYDTWHGVWPEKTKNELLIGGVVLKHDVIITGKIDKLECMDERCHDVRVIDYKTGAPKSRNEIEGLTATARRTSGSGGYKRQLIFYKLLLDKYADGKYRMQEAVLDFIEPTKSGTYKRELFVIESAEVRDLEAEIQRVAEEIRTLAFFDTRCADPDCSACALRELME